MPESSVSDLIIVAVEERRDKIVQLLQDLIRIDSQTGREAEAQAYVGQLLTDMGFELDVFEPDITELKGHPAFKPMAELDFAGRPNVVGVLRGDPSVRSLLLNGHIDTIPVGPVTEWIYDPFSGLVQDGEVHGRGASDMKSGVATMIAALQTLIEIGLSPRGPIIVESTVDEEASGYGTLACVIRGYKADAGICFETSDMMIMPAAIGRLWFKIELYGKSAGIATRWLAVDAIEKAMKIVKGIEDLEEIRVSTLTHPLYPDSRTALPCSVNMFNAGSYPSATPETAVLEGSLGTMPYEDLEDVKNQIRRQVELVSLADAWLREHPPVVSFEKLEAPGAEIPSDHSIVTTMKEAFAVATGRPSKIGGRAGAADTRFLIKYGETPTVIFGPGNTAKMHMVNESVSIENVIDAVKTTALSIHQWSK